MIRRDDLERRHHLGVRQLKRWGYKPEDFTDKRVGRAGITRKPCSSYCCGNPRKWFGEKTIQEKRAEIAAKDWE